MTQRISLFNGSQTRATAENAARLARGGTERRHFLRTIAPVVLAIVSLAISPVAIADQGRGTDNSTNQHWAASWATSPASYFVYAAPIVQNQAMGFSTTKSAVAN